MSTWIRFQELKERVSLEAVLLNYYRLDTLKRRGHKLIGPCPVHRGDNPRAFHADLRRGLWHCFTGCQGGGDQLALVAKLEGISTREAALRLHRHFLGDTNARPAPRIHPLPVAPPAENPPLPFKLTLNPTHPALRARDLSQETIQSFGIGYANRGIMKGCIAIPIHDHHGRLVAYAGRRLDPGDIERYGKYTFPKGFHKELVLYHLHRAARVASTYGLIVVEGFFSVMQLTERGIPGVVAVMGASLSTAQAKRIIAAKPRRVVLLFDGDQAGQLGSALAETLLAPHVSVLRITPPDGAEPEDFSNEEFNHLIAP